MIKFNTTQVSDIYEYLVEMNPYFIPKLDDRVDIKEYSKKIYQNALRLEIFKQDRLSGLLGCYINEEEGFSFITVLSVLPQFQKQGIAQLLIDELLNKLIENSKINRVVLEVSNENSNAIAFYKKNNFKIIKSMDSSMLLSKSLNHF